MKEEAKKEGLEIIMYKRYVDDINVVARIKQNKQETQEKENEENREGLKQTVKYKECKCSKK